MRTWQLLTLVQLLVLPLACTKPPPNVSPAELAVQVRAGNHAFTTELYGKIAEKQTGNIFFSPSSVTTAMAMALDGARGQTATEMQQVLHLSRLPSDALLAQRRRLMLAPFQSTTDYELRVANKLWPATGWPFAPEYLALTAADWGAQAEPIDFANASEPGRQRINQWVEEQTNHKITNLISASGVGPATILVLTSVIYFKGVWSSPFDEYYTSNLPFYLTSSKTVLVPFMRHHSQYGYAAVKDAELVSLPYKGDTLELVIVVPKASDGLPAVEQQLATAGTLDRWLDALKVQGLRVYLPRFKATFQVDLTETLSTLGMKAAFTKGQADFTGMSKRGDLYFSQVLHKAFIDVNEAGTEATAAIEASAGRGAEDSVRADKPFLYLIHDKKSGAVLFMGRAADPTKAD